MPKKTIPTNELERLSRPQRCSKAKVVFDPSDLHVPKKRKKKSNQFVIVKSGQNNRSGFTIRLKRTSTNGLLGVSSNKDDSASLSSEYSLSYSPTSYDIPEINQEEITICCMCIKDTANEEGSAVICPICLIRTHSECLLVNEPTWRFTSGQHPWFCAECREKYCVDCREVESKSCKFRCCVACRINLHVKCLKLYTIKPFHKLKPEMYICIPCMTLAAQSVPKVVEDEETRPKSGSSSTSDNNNNNNNGDGSKPYCSSPMSQPSDDKHSLDEYNHPIPDVSEWDSFKIYQYLSYRCLPESVTNMILAKDLDGKALLELQRSDITCDMGLKLGPALKLYKELRILQTKSTCVSSYWE